MVLEQLFEIWEILEYRDETIYKTHNTGKREWIRFGDKPPNGILYVSVSDEIETIRIKRE